MPSDHQRPHEPETESFQRTRRGVAAGAVMGAVVGASAGAIGGGLVHGWGSTAMWGWIVFGLVGGIGLGLFFGGMGSLQDPPGGEEPLPDARLRGDVDLPNATPALRTGLSRESSEPPT